MSENLLKKFKGVGCWYLGVERLLMVGRDRGSSGIAGDRGYFGWRGYSGIAGGRGYSAGAAGDLGWLGRRPQLPGRDRPLPTSTG